MKKLTKIILTFFVAIMAVASVGFGNFPKSEVSASSIQDSQTFVTDISEVLRNYVTFKNRLAGSDGEKEASEFIKNYLSQNTSLTPKDNAYVLDGVQTFTFESVFSSIYETSQNIIFEYESGKDTDKKIIIGTHYDAVAFKNGSLQTKENIVESESVTGSAGNVATLLVLAKYLPSLNLNFDVEIVFFGAGESNNAGSNFYTQGITDEEKKNILCYINFDSIAVGKYTYFYVDEVSNKLSNLISDVASNGNTNVSMVKTYNLSKVMTDNTNELGLNYYHLAMNSDNYSFMKNGITAINFFAGDYSYGVALGLNEYENNEIIKYTENDNLDYISKTYGSESITKNLYDVYKTVCLTLTDSNLESAIMSAKNSLNWFYMFFGNENLVVYLSVIAFIIFVIIALYIYHKLEIKSYYSNIEKEFLTTVVQISDEINANGVDENVAKAVSQVVARDIKKTKTIKSKKNNKNK